MKIYAFIIRVWKTLKIESLIKSRVTAFFKMFSNWCFSSIPAWYLLFAIKNSFTERSSEVDLHTKSNWYNIWHSLDRINILSIFVLGYGFTRMIPILLPPSALFLWYDHWSTKLGSYYDFNELIFIYLWCTLTNIP